MYKDILKETSHRTTEYPKSPWVASQLWKNLLFINYPVDVKVVKELVPKGLEVDTFDGKAWITVLPFKMADFKVRRFPLKGVSEFLELNVRTYVIRNGKPGIYFFSLEAENILAVFGARFATLPYYLADMSMTFDPHSGRYQYTSKRKINQQIAFEGSFTPSEKTYSLQQGSLTKWLADRYFLFSKFGDIIFEGPIHHRPWKVADVDWTINQNRMLPKLPLDSILEQPFLFYAYQKRVLFWPLCKA